MVPIGTIKDLPHLEDVDDDPDSDVTTPNSGTPAPGSTPCSSNLFDDLEEALKRCEVPMPRPSEVPSIKGKLDVQIATSAPSTRPGERIDVLVTLRNTTNEPLVLYFTGEPSSPRFDVEALDGRGRRVDLPSTKWPGYPKGFKPETPDAKVAKITLDKNGAAHVKTTWDAVKTKWAPEKAKTWEGRGHPRVPSGPLGPGKYTLRVVLPLIGDDGDVEAPNVVVTVDKA